MARSRTPRIATRREGSATIISVEVDPALLRGRGVMPPPVRVHDAHKASRRYQRRADRRALRRGDYD